MSRQKITSLLAPVLSNDKVVQEEKCQWFFKLCYFLRLQRYDVIVTGLNKPLQLQEVEAPRISRQSVLHTSHLTIKSMKNPSDPNRNQTRTTFWLAVQCLNQLHYSIPIVKITVLHFLKYELSVCLSVSQSALTFVISLRSKFQLIQIDSIPAQDSGQKFIKCNMLCYGCKNATTVLVEALIVPVGVHHM